MKYYDIHVNDGITSFSCFVYVKDGLLTGSPMDEEIAGHAVDIGKLNVDDLGFVDNITEISEEEFKKATK